MGVKLQSRTQLVATGVRFFIPLSFHRRSIGRWARNRRMHTRALTVHLCGRRGKSRDDVNDLAVGFQSHLSLSLSSVLFLFSSIVPLLLLPIIILRQIPIIILSFAIYVRSMRSLSLFFFCLQSARKNNLLFIKLT